MQGGQILVIVVFAIVGLVSFVGLVVDTGLVFIGYGKLRRATDAAALAAAAEYRANPNPVGLSNDAKEFLTLNNVDNTDAHVFVCNPDPAFIDYNDDSLCINHRRLVKVNTLTRINLAFLPVIGIRQVTLNATATSEAASLDIVFLLDVSDSMTHNEAQYSLMRDPAECNDVLNSTSLTNCHPFREIQQAAIKFISDPTHGLFPADGSNQYDRVAVIPFDRKAHWAPTGMPPGLYNLPLYLGDQASFTPVAYRQQIIDEIAGLRVYNASGSVSSGGPKSDGSCLDGNGNLTYPAGPHAPCRLYPENSSPYCFEQPVMTDPPHWKGETAVPQDESVFDDPLCFTATPAGSPHLGPFIRPSDGMHFERAYLDMSCPPLTDPADCPGTTNTGGAFRASGSEFVRQPGFRQESLWVVILLTDGIADHADSDAAGHNLYCPNGDGARCQDSNVATIDNVTVGRGRHCLPANDPLYAGNPFLFTACTTPPEDGGGGVVDATQYDVDDYARDMADFVALGQQALIYTIGFGTDMHQGTAPYSGEQLLNYAADIGDDGKINTPAGTLNPNYFFAPSANDLVTIFNTISQRIATRLTH